VVILLLLAVAPAIFFIYDLWAVAAAVFLSLPFVFKKLKFPPVFAWILFFIFAGFFVSGRSAASFDSFTFFLQSVLYAASFLVGNEIVSRRSRPMGTVPIAAIGTVPIDPIDPIEAGTPFAAHYFENISLIPLAALALIPFLYAAKVSVNPNIVSSYAGLLFVLLMISGAGKKLKYILGALALFFIAFNGSWTVIFVLGAAAAMAGKKKYLPLVLFLGVAAAAVNPRSVMDRFFWWSETLKIFAENPAGIGFFASKYYLAATSAQNTIFAHSFFLQLLGEGGIFCIAPMSVAGYFFFKNKKGGKYDFAFYAVLLLGVLDLSYYITAHGMLGAFIIGLTQKHEEVPRKISKVYTVFFRSLFVFAAALSVIMFLNSRALSRGAGFLFAGDARRAEAVFEKAFEYPRYPALMSAKVAAYSIISEREGLSELRKRSFQLQEKALPAKNLKIPAYRDFDAAREAGDLRLLRNSCMKILFLNGIKPRH